MKRTFVAILATALLASLPASAAAPKVEAAVKAFSGIEGDGARLKRFCDMFKTMTLAESEQDEKKAQKMEDEIDAHMKALGADFMSAWELQADLDAESSDGKSYYEAADKLMAKCPKA